MPSSAPQSVDVVLVIGCSGAVTIVEQLIKDALSANGDCKVIEINPEPGLKLPRNLAVLPMTAVEGLGFLDKYLRCRAVCDTIP